MASTGRNGPGVDIRLLPEAGAWEETMFQTGSRGAVEVEVGKIEFHGGQRVFVSEINAGHAFVVGGECDGDPRGAVGWKRMPGCADAEDDIVGSEIDLDHDVTCSHLF